MTALAFTEKLIWSLPTALPVELLDLMEKQFDELEFSAGTVGIESTTVNKTTRDSDVKFLPWDEWIPAMMWSIMHTTNQEYFKYDLNYWETNLQATRYSGEGKQHYGWHYDEIHGAEKQRKLSCSLLLNEDYEGGELEFYHCPDNDWSPIIKPKRGEMIIFPAWLSHRVRQVTSGTRKSLVGWAWGPPFR